MSYYCYGGYAPDRHRSGIFSTPLLITLCRNFNFNTMRPIQMFFLVGLFAIATTASADTGAVSSELGAFDKAMLNILSRWKIPGGALAVTHNGRLVLARGYGFADVEKKIPVTPQSMFRIASVSKPITAVAVIHLMEAGKIGLDDQAVAHLLTMPDIGFADSDPRLWDIRVRDLLQHTAGWDREVSGDVMFSPLNAYSQPHVRLINTMFQRQLDYAPGTRYAYSNFGFHLLGRIIEQLTGETYYDYVRQQVLEPANISAMRLAVRGAERKTSNEVTYYPGHNEDAHGFNIESMDAHGGWLASVVDLAKFMTSIDGNPQPPDQILLDSLTKLLAPPVMAGKQAGNHASDAWYGLGVGIFRSGKSASWSHGGSLPGSLALVVNTGTATTWAVLFNGRPSAGDATLDDISNRLWQASNGISDWPEHNLFE